MSSNFSVGGLISGLNTQDMIQSLMSIERRPLLQLQRRADAETARVKSVGALQTSITTLQSMLTNLVARNTLNAKSVVTDTPSTSPTVLTASAGADAINGTYRVTVNQLATSTRTVSNGPLGRVIDRTATLASAGFRRTPVVADSLGAPATFSINGQSISVSGTTTLDDGTANSIINKINGAGASVTASLIADADGRANNRLQLISAAGQSIQLGALGDTSNVLRLLNLADAVVQGHTASTVTGAAADAGALNTSLTINGVTTTINQSNGTFDAAQNASFIASAINANAANTVTAVGNVDGTLTLTQKTLGAQPTIDVTAAGAGTGLSVGVTDNGTDRVVSTSSLGVANIGAALADSRLVTPIAGLDGSGNGAFKINGVAIAYNANDSITSIVNRINSASTGATAFYDPVQDRLRLTASKTGSTAISLEDTTGNFLAATGVLAATQTLGQNAVFRIDGVNDGAALTSSTNTITDYIPGVTLDLKSASASPVTITVSQNTSTTVAKMRDFVSAFNAVLDSIETQTRYDVSKKSGAPLSGDPSVVGIQRQLRSLVNAAAFGVSGSYRSLADLGLTTGAVGTEVGTATRLQLDESKLSTALNTNPQAVETVLAGFQATLGNPSGAGNITAVTGTPLKQHENGTYRIKVLNASNDVEVRFVASDGRELMKTTGTLTPGQENTTLIPGVKLRASGALAVGEDTFALNVTSRGVGVGLQDYLGNLLGESGFFKSRTDSSATVSRDIAERISRMEGRLKDRETALTRRFTVLETTMARLQSQGGALAGAIARLSAQTQ